jgi:hypothetical protein
MSIIVQNLPVKFWTMIALCRMLILFMICPRFSPLPVSKLLPLKFPLAVRQKPNSSHKRKLLLQKLANYHFKYLNLSTLSACAIHIEPKNFTDCDTDHNPSVRSGALSSWLVTDSTVSSKPSYGSVPPSEGFIPLGIKDANDDGRSDIYWYNANTGAVSAWLMNAGKILSKVSYGGLSSKNGWKPYGLADFDNDNKFDLVWYNSFSGQLQIWYINGTTVFRKLQWGTLPPNTGKFPAGIKDLNGNGYPDLLIFNIYTGDVEAWLDSGAGIHYAQLNISAGWAPIGLEDMNGDFKSDLLLYNTKSGEIVVWLINGSTILREVTWGRDNLKDGLGIAGFHDFNGDGRSDILWYNGITGNIKAWITGGGIVNYGTGSPSAGWQPMGLDDFNGDGKADLLWFNAFTNATTTWLLNGKGVLQSANYGSIPASSVWTINIPR